MKDLFFSTEITILVFVVFTLVIIVAIILRIEFSYSVRRFKKLNQEINNLKKRDLKNFFIIDKFLTIPVWIRDSNGKISYINNIYKKLTDSGDEDFLEISSKSQNIAEKVIKENKELSEEVFLVLGNQRIPMKVTEAPFLDSVQYNEGSIGFAFDIKEIEKQRSDIKYINSIYQNFFNYSSTAVAIFDAMQKLTFYNQAFVKLWKLKESFLQNYPSYSEILEELRSKSLIPEQINFRKYKEQALSVFTSIVRTDEELLYLPDNRTLRQVIIPLSNGSLLFSYDDQTNVLELERSYNVLLSVQKQTIDNINEGVAVFTEDGILNFCNQKFLQLLDKTEIQGKIHYQQFFATLQKDIISLNDISNWQDIKQKFISFFNAGNKAYEVLELKNNTYYEFFVTILPDASRLFTINNITDSYKLQKALTAERDALEKANIQKINFLKNVSYQIRSPLTTIMGYSELIKEFSKAGYKNIDEGYLDNILESSKQLSNLIEDIIILTKENKENSEIESVELTKILKNNIGRYKNNLKSLPKEFFIRSNKISFNKICLFLFKNIGDFCEKNKYNFFISLEKNAIEILVNSKNENHLNIFENYSNYKKLSKELDFLLIDLLQKNANVEITETKENSSLIIKILFQKV